MSTTTVTCVGAPMTFTTNEALREWGRVLHDHDLAVAILGRVLERRRLITLDGLAARTRHLNLEEALPQDDQRSGVSPISGSEVPEPTRTDAAAVAGAKRLLERRKHRPAARLLGDDGGLVPSE